MADTKAAETATAGDKAPAELAPNIIGEFDITTPSWTIGEIRVTKVAVHKISYRTLCEAIDAANAARALAKAPAKQRGKYIRREQMLRQVRAIDSNGAPHELKIEQLMRMPRKYAVIVDSLVDALMDDAGEVIGEGDGALTPILYRLGKPIIAPNVVVEELEFMARTLMDIEDVLSAESASAQTLELLKIAKPIVPNNPGLVRLPDQWLGQITIVDGHTIADKVLPRFFD